jgi:uncharacterized membrane protein
MKRSSIVCASVVALAAFAAGGAFAAVNYNSSKCNCVALTAQDPTAANDCIAGGGTVSTDKDGTKVCTGGTYIHRKLPGKMKSGQLSN